MSPQIPFELQKKKAEYQKKAEERPTTHNVFLMINWVLCARLNISVSTCHCIIQISNENPSE